MSDEQIGPVDLAFIGRALQRPTTDLATLRDEMRVQTAIILRLDAAIARRMPPSMRRSNSCARCLRSTSATADRVRALEDRIEDQPVR